MSDELMIMYKEFKYLDGLRGREVKPGWLWWQVTSHSCDYHRVRAGQLTHLCSGRVKRGLIKCCPSIKVRRTLLGLSVNCKQHIKKQEEMKMFKTLIAMFLILSLSMFAQSAPAADPEPQTFGGCCSLECSGRRILCNERCDCRNICSKIDCNQPFFG